WAAGSARAARTGGCSTSMTRATAGGPSERSWDPARHARADAAKLIPITASKKATRAAWARRFGKRPQGWGKGMAAPFREGLAARGVGGGGGAGEKAARVGCV